MGFLLIHPDDNQGSGPWRDLSWSGVIDLGLSGRSFYKQCSQNHGCPVVGLTSLHLGLADLRHVRDLLTAGRGRLLDNHGLDWWEILSIRLAEQLESVILLERLVEEVAGDEVYISRPGFHASVMQNLLKRRAHIFPLRRGDRGLGGLIHYIRAARKLSVSQIADVLCDKYDPGYRLRAHVSRRRRASGGPVVLIPTAYVNVSRTGIAYAETLPQQDFLLVSTRRSGWMKTLPSNVASAWLSSYAVARDRSAEAADMESRWRRLLTQLVELKEFKILNDLGQFSQFPQQLRHGLEVRDAWRNVLDREPVQAVLCADDSNPFTRIPLLLARERGLPNIACHHGALDGYYALKSTYADVILAKGKMEQDYLVQRCGVPADRVEIGAPAAPALTALPNKQKKWTRIEFRPHILFVSECYEVGNARAQEFYRDVLPPLADLALNTGRKLIVKLHPTESKSERVAMVKRVLSSQQMTVTQVVDGPLTDSLLDATWFAVSVLSTVAVECALRNIPCFLCNWLEYSFYGYIDQFIRYGVGIRLNGPSELLKLPEYLEKYEPDPAILANCWEPIQAERLLSLFTSSPKVFARAAS